MDQYDLEGQAVGRSVNNTRLYGSGVGMGEGRIIQDAGGRTSSGTIGSNEGMTDRSWADVKLAGSGGSGEHRVGTRRGSRGSKIFTETPMYSQEAAKRRHRMIIGIIIFVCFVALGVGIFIHRGGNDSNNNKEADTGGANVITAAPIDNGDPAEVGKATVIGAQGFPDDEDGGEDVNDDEIAQDVEEETEEELEQEEKEAGDQAENALEAEKDAIEAEEQDIQEEIDDPDTTEKEKELLKEENEALSELEDAVAEEEAIEKEMDNAETEEEVELLDEEAGQVELIEDNLSEQADLLDQASQTDDPDEAKELEDEVEQLKLQEQNLENQLDATVNQEQLLPQGGEGEEEEGEGEEP